MIHHNNPKFAFIHLPKCGGTSVGNTLANYLEVPKQQIRSRPEKFLYAKRFHHGKFYGAQQNKVNIDDYFIFSLTRNPWTRMVSYFHYSTSRPKTQHMYKDLTFETWMLSAYYKALDPQMAQLSDGSSGISKHIDYVAKLETIDKDWPVICENLGIDCEFRHDKVMIYDHSDYATFYSAKTKDMVYKFYKDDINTLGYEFPV